jgi:hypothetical protein
MRLQSAAILMLLLAQPIASATAKPSAAQPAAKDTAVLKQGADALIKQAASPPGQPGNPSPNQGAEHAALRAIQVVCSKDTPAAQRSAICRPNSPF